MMWEKYCRFEEEKEWHKSKLVRYADGDFLDIYRTTTTSTAFLEFERLGSESVMVPAKLLSWPAFFFGAFWFLSKRQWLLGSILIAFYMIVPYPAPVVLLHIFLGLAGNKCLELYLLRRGYNFKRIRVLQRTRKSDTKYESGIHRDSWYSYDEQGWKDTREKEIREIEEALEMRERARQREREEAEEEAERKAFFLEKMGRPKKTTDQDG